MRLRATHTHLYPGAGGTIVDFPGTSADATPSPCHVEFSDGSAAAGTLALHSESSGVLEVGGYTTAAGTDVATKHWHVEVSTGQDGDLRFRVRVRLL